MEPDQAYASPKDRLWRNLLYELSLHLTTKDWKDLLDLALVPDGVAESIKDSSGALKCLEKYGVIKQSDPPKLRDLLKYAKHMDLLRLIDSYEKELDSTKETIPPQVPTRQSLSTLKGQCTKHTLLTPNSFTSARRKGSQPMLNDEKCTSVEAALEGSDSRVSPSLNNSHDTEKQSDGHKTAKGMDRHVKYGYCIIMNIEHFHGHEVEGRKLLDRKGSSIDRDNLKDTFEWLGMEVETLDDPTAQKAQKKLMDYASRDYSNMDVFVCAILSHGFNGGVYTSDGKHLFIDDLRRMFMGTHNITLTGKPKLFFIQACRGDGFDFGSIMPDAPSTKANLAESNMLPSSTDFLFAYAVTPGNVSWRSESSGSWFVSTLCLTLQQEAGKENLQTMLTHANYKLGEKCGRPNDILVKQGGEHSSSLRYVIYFCPASPWKPRFFDLGQCEANGKQPDESEES